jgi:hypothetical protein
MSVSATKVRDGGQGIGWILPLAWYFAILLMLAFLVSDVPGETKTLWLTIEDVIAGRANGYGDPRSFATAALDIYNTGWLRPEHIWVFNTWPPGFALLQAALLFVFGPDVPIITALQVCAALLFALLLTLVYRTLRPVLGPVWAFVAGLAPFAFPVVRVFLLQPTGVSFGETFGVGFFLIGAILSLDAARRPQPFAMAIAAGIFLGLSAYMQSRFELYVMALSASGVVLVVLALSRALNLVFRTRVSWQSGVTVIVAIVAAQIVMLPWRLYHYVEIKSLAWSHSAASIYINSVQTSADLDAHRGGFVRAGGGNLACRIDPSTCGDVAHAEELFYRTLLGHPWEWISIKASLFGQYWFAPMGYWANVGRPPTAADFIFNGIIAAMAVAALLLPLLSRRLRQQPQWLVLVWFAWTLLATCGLIFLLVHLEARYFFLAKVAYTLLFILVVRMAWVEQGGHSAARNRAAGREIDGEVDAR